MRDLKRVTVHTTVQPQAITFPTDAKLLHAAMEGLNRQFRKHGVRLRRSYRRIVKSAAMMAGCYAHAKQFKRHHANCACCAAGLDASSSRAHFSSIFGNRGDRAQVKPSFRVCA